MSNRKNRRPGPRRVIRPDPKRAWAGPRWPRRVLLGAIASLAIVMVIVAVTYRISILKAPAQPGAKASRPQQPLPISFIGARACASCHVREYQAWEGSHHQLAMQPANDSTVLGDFNDARFTRASITSRFYRRDGKFVVSTDGPDGAIHDYRIKFTFGVSPLQQYLIEFSGGRLQALGIAWDSRPRDHGGQRWFDLYPGQTISYRDPLHWTAIQQNWNFMCADCHSTNLRKNYDLGSRTYATTYAEINVACEACHGPGSRHVAWARKAQGWLHRRDRNNGLLIALDEPQKRGLDNRSRRRQRAAQRCADVRARNPDVCAMPFTTCPDPRGLRPRPASRR